VSAGPASLRITRSVQPPLGTPKPPIGPSQVPPPSRLRKTPFRVAAYTRWLEFGLTTMSLT
jgi:hypothetical protein